MKVEIEDGRLIVTPIMGEAVRCTEDAFTDFFIGERDGN